MTLNLAYQCILASTGMSVADAATFHEVSDDQIIEWIGGSEDPPDEVMDAISQLVCRMAESVGEVVDHVLDKAEQIMEEPHAFPDVLELGLASDDAEAQTLGWPNANAHRTVIGMTAAQISDMGIRVSVVPRGSTVTSAAAADAYDKGDTR